MLNLAIKKLNRRLLHLNRYRNSMQIDNLMVQMMQGQWFNDNKSYSFHPKEVPQSTQSFGFSGSALPSINFLNPAFNEPISLQSFVKLSNESSKNAQKAHNFSHFRNYDLDNFQTLEFNLSISQEDRKLNTEILMNKVANLLTQNEQKQFAKVVGQLKNLIASKQNGRISTKEQKKLFNKVYNIFLKGLNSIELAKSLFKTFSESDLQLIKSGELRNFNDTQNWMAEFQRKPNKISLNSIDKELEEIHAELVDSTPKVEKKENSEVLDIIQKLENSHKKPKLKMKNIKLVLKKQTEVEKLKIDKESIAEVEKKLLGNKKMVTEHIILKRVHKDHNEKQKNFGDNWVYVYDLPYNFDRNKAIQIVNAISQRYGEIVEFKGESFKNFVQKSSTETIFHIPDNFSNESTKKRIKIETQQYIKNQLEEENSREKKSMGERILERSKKQGDLYLNKSTMVFKFKNKSDKMKFLTHEMRVYGLCLPKLRNIRFEEAQSKNVVALSMIPWACESAHLIKFINESLTSLKISVTHPNCIIANGYVFLELANFYEALYSKDLLNNLVFQDQRIKAQLCYGSSYIHQGQYKFRFEEDHYERLLEKLAENNNDYNRRMLG